MKILFDECVDRRLKNLLTGHEVLTVQQMHWSRLKNGELLTLAAQEFDIFLTVDRNMSYQQNWSGRRIAVLLLSAGRVDLPALRPLVPKLLVALDEISPGAFVEVEG